LAYIPDGSVLYYEGTWPQTVFSLPGSILEDVSTALNGAGLTVRSSNITSGQLSQIEGQPFGVRLTLQVENGLGFGSPDDAISLVRHAVYIETGKFPLSDTIPRVQVPGGTPTKTGQPGGAPQGAGCIAGTSNDLSGSFSLGCWWDNLTSKGLSTIGLIFIGGILAVALIVFAKER